MTTNDKKHTRLLRVTLAGAVLAAPLLLAAAGGEGQGQGPHGRRGFGHDSMGPGRAMGLLRELDLSDDQTQQIRALFEEAESSGAHKRLMEARRALNDAIESGTDEGEIRQLAYQVGQSEGDAAVERARAQVRIHEILTDSQRQELDRLKLEMKEEMAERQKQFEERRRKRSEGSR